DEQNKKELAIRDAKAERDRNEREALDRLLRKEQDDKRDQDQRREAEDVRKRAAEAARVERERQLREREARLATKEGEAVVASRYEQDMRQAAKLAESEDYEKLWSALGPWEPAATEHDYRGWEWHYLRAVAARASSVRPHQADPKSDD